MSTYATIEEDTEMISTKRRERQRKLETEKEEDVSQKYKIIKI